jgi:hypothetical protein
METEPKTATEMVMLDMEERRIEARDRQVAMSVAREMVDRFFKPDEIEDMSDVRRQIINAAEFAAYTAIQKERELHAHDMAALKAWADVRWADAVLKPPPFVVPASDSDTRPKDGDAKQGSTRE